MSQPGYHPICVLFQGNDCAFDGTYRLVCRHQVRQQDFQPGDNVEVDMGDDDDGPSPDQDDDDDVTVINKVDGTRWRDAIALGDEMVMSVLRNMCKNQPTGSSPWSSNSKQAKRRRDQDRMNDEYGTSKRIKSEECTTSEETHNRVDSQQSEHLLQNILSAIHSVQATQENTASEIRNILQNQQRLNNQVTAIQRTLCRLENTKAYGPAESDVAATPVSLYLSQAQSSSSLALGASDTCSGLAVNSPATQPSPVASTSPINSPSQIIISNPVSQGQPDLSTFPTQEPLDSSVSSLPPLYPIEGNLFSHPQIHYNFNYTDDSETRVFLGYPDSPLTLSKNEMEEILFKTNTPPAFAYRLAGKIFTPEELLNSNTSGKGSRKTGKVFKQLDLKSVNIILIEVEKRFPTCRNTRESTRRLFAAINERCRNERKKIVYRNDGKNESGLTITNTQSLRAPLQDDH